VVILVIIIVIVVRRKRKSKNISTLATGVAQAADNITYEMQPKKDDTIKNIYYAKPRTVIENNIDGNSEHPTSLTFNKPAGSNKNLTNSYENLLAENDNVHKFKKTRTSSLSLMHRKESSSKCEQLLTVVEPGDDP